MFSHNDMQCELPWSLSQRALTPLLDQLQRPKLGAGSAQTWTLNITLAAASWVVTVLNKEQFIRPRRKWELSMSGL